MFRGGSPASGIASFTGGTGVPIKLAESVVQVATPADTTEDVLATVTIPANTVAANGQIRVWAMFSYTNSANNKTMRARLGGIGGTVYFTATRTSQLVTYAQVWIGNVNATNSQAGFYLETSAGATSQGTRATSAIDMTASTTLVITGQKGLGSETLNLEGYGVEFIN